MKPIIQSDRDRDMLNWLILSKGITRAAIEAQAENIAASGKKAYASNIVKSFGFSIFDVEKRTEGKT